MNVPFTKEELIKAIRENDDSDDTCIVITKEGVIKVISFHGVRDRKDIAVRTEAFVAGNGYVGRLASEDEKYVDETFDLLVKSWSKYTTDGREIFADGYE